MDINYTEECLRYTRRKYRDGYGFSTTCIKRDLTPSDFRLIAKRAWECVRRVSEEGGQDAVDFVKYYTDSKSIIQPDKGWRWWLIEAVQLIHTDALFSKSSQSAQKSAQILERIGHTGFYSPKGYVPNRTE